jgi:hypothetical protein
LPAVEAPPPETAIPLVPRRGHGQLVALVALVSVLGGFLVGRDPDLRAQARARMRTWVATERKEATGPYAAMLDDATVTLATPVMPEETVVQKRYDAPLVPAAGVTTRWPARGRHRERLLAAEKERDMTGFPASAAAEDPGAALRAGAAERRQEDYGEFLRREGLAAPDEEPQAAPPPPPPAAAPAPAPQPPPAPPLLNPSDRSEQPSKSDLKPP